MMGVREIDRSLEQWQMGVKDLRRRMILAPTPRERERWYAMLLLAQGSTAAATGEALERDPHSVDVRAVWGFPPALGEAQQADLKAAVQEPPAESGIELANWTLRQAQEEGGPSVRLGEVLYWPEPKQLPELVTPLGVCPEEAQETPAQG